MFQVDIERKKAYKEAQKRFRNKPFIPSNTDFLQFGYTLKAIRKVNHITLAVLAATANTYSPRLSEYESGKRVPNLQTAEGLYIALRSLGVNEKEIERLQSAYNITLQNSKPNTLSAVYKVI